jgi:signal transduction histidine kinase
MRPGSSSISARLRWMNLLVSGTVLVLAALSFFFYDLVSFRQNLIGNLTTAAEIVGTNSVSALVFDDPQSATTTLEALGDSPDVLGVVLTTADGRVFAQYQRNPKAPLPETRALAPGTQAQSWVTGDRVLLAHRIVFQGKPVGAVYIEARLTETGHRAEQYLLIAFIILLLCMAAALGISSRARRMVATPIAALAETARRVTRERDYSVRASPQGGENEIAVLVDSFNEMLQEIQQRDTALSRARDHLEIRVAERTAELQSANRELEAFSYTVAHDLRGPLDAVQGMVYILESIEKEAPLQERHEILEQLRRATGNMATLIDDLLNLSRAATTPLKRGPVDLTRMARELAEDLHRAEPQRQVQFMIARIPEVQADAGLMRVVLDNLLRNAWKYTSRREQACIEFGAVARRGETVYFVRDDGAGFDPALAEHLFQPFQRLHSRSEFPGTGIGLATVQRILMRHGGRIWAEGAVAKGATFWFTLGSGPVAA